MSQCPVHQDVWMSLIFKPDGFSEGLFCPACQEFHDQRQESKAPPHSPLTPDTPPIPVADLSDDERHPSKNK